MEEVAVMNPRVAMSFRMTVGHVMDPEMRVDPVTDPKMSVEVNNTVFLQL